MSTGFRKEFWAAEPMPPITNALSRYKPYDHAIFDGISAAADLIREDPNERLANFPLAPGLVNHPDVPTSTLARMINDSLHRQPSSAPRHYPMYHQWVMSKCPEAEMRFSRIIGSLIDPSLSYVKREKQGFQVIVDEQGEPFILRKRRASSALILQSIVVEGIGLQEGFIGDVDLFENGNDPNGRNGIAKEESTWLPHTAVAGICPGRLSAFAIAAAEREKYFPTDMLEEPQESPPGLESQAFREFDILTIRNTLRQAIDNGLIAPKHR